MTDSPRRRPPRRSNRASSTLSTRSLVDEVEATAAGAQDMAAARLALSVSETIRRAMEVCGLRQQELAQLVGVTPGRVSQVLSDGNIRMATLGRFARALGYQARVVFDPLEEGRPDISERRSRRTVTTFEARSPNLAPTPRTLKIVGDPQQLQWGMPILYVGPTGRHLEPTSENKSGHVRIRNVAP